jgi:aminopeptidase N
MNKILFAVSISLILFSCKSGKSKFDDADGPVAEESYYDGSEYEYDTTEIYDEGYGDYDEFEAYEEPKVRGIYNSSRTLLTDLIHTKLEVSFDWEKSQMKGKATITAKQHFYASDSLILDAKGMDVSKVEMNGKTMTFNYTDSLKLRIKLDKVYTRDEKYTVVIDYVSKPEERKTGGSSAITSDKGLYFINPKGEIKGKMPQIWTQGETEANSVWFPTVDAPNAKSTQEMYITVADKYLTLSNGKLLDSKKNADGSRTDHWKQDLPHAPYLFMMAVGEFKVIKDTYVRQDGSKMDVNYYVEPEYEASAKAIFGETPNMIKFFSQKLGVEFPWDKYSQIVVRDYVSGAMENTGAVIFGDFVYKTERELMDANDQSTVAHELFHHWFGDLVTCESWANLPLNESFANYSQYLWDEYRFGIDEADYQAEQEANGYFDNGMSQGYHNLIWYSHFDKEDMFDGHSYNKGGRILHMLRNYLGDEAFFKGLNNYLTTNKYKAAEVHNLRMAFEEVTGEDLNWFFDQWFLGKGHPIVFTTQTINPENHTVTIGITQKQNTEDFPIYKLPVSFAIWDANGKRTEKVTIDSLEQSFTFAYTGELKNVLFDENQVLLGKYYEDKPTAQFVHQYYNSSRYKARYTAIKRLSHTKSDVVDKLLYDAMNDPFWHIRSTAIEHYSKSKTALEEKVLLKVKEIAQNDAKSQTRAEAINCLTSLSSEEATIFFKDVIAKEKSFLVISTALQVLSDINPKEALDYARGMEKENVKSMNVTVGEIYSQQGEAQDYEFFDKLLKSGTLKGYDELRVMFAYVVYMIRMDIDLQEKSHSVFSYLNENGGNYTKMYLSRAIEYSMSTFQEKINALEMEIAELEAAKSFGQADEKKRIKQRYEDLISNLTPMLTVEEEGGY